MRTMSPLRRTSSRFRWPKNVLATSLVAGAALLLIIQSISYQAQAATPHAKAVPVSKATRRQQSTKPAAAGLDNQRVRREPASDEPLAYKRLRFDPHYLQVYRYYQKYLAIDETKRSIKFNETQLIPSDDGGKSSTTCPKVEPERERTLEYYVNEAHKASDLTYDDLVFEALNRAYLARLWPSYNYHYDNKADLAKASDLTKVSCARCNKELDFLLSSLVEIEKARETAPTQGVRLSNRISPEVLAFLDATAGEEPGLLLGHSYWTGASWRECGRRQVFSVDTKQPGRSVDFSGRYCVASIRSPNWDAKIRERSIELTKSHFYWANQSVDYNRFFRIKVGMCLPESCDSRTIETRRSDLHRLATHKLTQPFQSYELVDLYCLPDETSELRQLGPDGLAFVWFMGAWLALVFIATFIHYRHNEVQEEEAWAAAAAHQPPPKPRPMGAWQAKLVSIFSLQTNWGRFVETKSCQRPPPLSSRMMSLQEAVLAAENRLTGKTTTTGKPTEPGAHDSSKLQRNDMLFMNFVKVMGTLLILVAHSGMMWKQFDRYPNDLDNLNSNTIKHFFIYSPPVAVDWFFAISGFLLAYTLFAAQRVGRNSLMEWLYMIVHRYFRLMPLYMLVFWFVKSVVVYTSTGPLWDYATSAMTEKAYCMRQDWWHPLTLSVNYRPLHGECVMPAWFISNDMQFHIVAPFLLILLHKSPILGWLAGFGVIGACLAIRFHAYMTEQHAQLLDLMRPRYDLYVKNNWDIWYTYVLPQYRISPFIVGILAGHYCYMVLSGRWKSALHVDPEQLVATVHSGRARMKSVEQMERIIEKSKQRRLFVGLFGLTLFISLCWSTLFIDILFPSSWEPHVSYFVSAIYASYHALSALSLILIIIAFMLNGFKHIREFMSWPVWTLITRCHYPLFLIQVEVIIWFLLSSDSLSELNDFEVVKSWLYIIGFIYPLGAAISIFVEYPLIQLEKNFIHPIFNSHKPKPGAAGRRTDPSGKKNGDGPGAKLGSGGGGGGGSSNDNGETSRLSSTKGKD